MKKQILSIVAILSLIMSLSMIGFAGLNGRVKVDIPFDFSIGGKQFQAGKYSFDRFNGGSTVVIRSVEKGQAANFITFDVTGRGEPQAKLIFHRYGNQYFLAQIYDGQGNQGVALPKSNAEREASKKRDTITQNIIEPEIETIVGQAGK